MQRSSLKLLSSAMQSKDWFLKRWLSLLPRTRLLYASSATRERTNALRTASPTFLWICEAAMRTVFSRAVPTLRACSKPRFLSSSPHDTPYGTLLNFSRQLLGRTQAPPWLKPQPLMTTCVRFCTAPRTQTKLSHSCLKTLPGTPMMRRSQTASTSATSSATQARLVKTAGPLATAITSSTLSIATSPCCTAVSNCSGKVSNHLIIASTTTPTAPYSPSSEHNTRKRGACFSSWIQFLQVTKNYIECVPRMHSCLIN